METLFQTIVNSLRPLVQRNGMEASPTHFESSQGENAITPVLPKQFQNETTTLVSWPPSGPEFCLAWLLKMTASK